MSYAAITALVIILTVVVSVAGLYLLRWKYPATKLARNQHIVDPMLNVVATLYSIFLGFLIAGAMDRYEAIKTATESEATTLANLFHLARGLPEKERKSIRQSCREYCQAAINEEWPLMEERKASDKANQIYLSLWDAILAVVPDDEREVNTHEAMLTTVEELAEARRMRLVSMRKQFPAFIWLVIYASSGVTVFLTYFFVTRETRLHSMMIALVAVTICLNVLVLAVLVEPFRGYFKIKPEGLASCSELFNSQNDDGLKDLPPPKPKSAANADD